MERVFICYSRKDETFVDQLAADLKAAGVPIWRDKEDIPSNIASSTRGWRRAIERALEQCTYMLLVLSPDAVESAEVEAEWHTFLEKEQPLYLVLLNECKIPYRINPLQRWDFQHSYDQPFAELLNLLPRDKTAILPADLEAAVNSPYAGVRQGAVIELVQLVQQDDNPALAQLAWVALGNLADDDSQSVSDAAGEALSNPPHKLASELILGILPAPFEWCEIPAGRVTLESNAGAFNVQPFLMAKYPITYEQFQVFIDDPQGFTNLEWWAGLVAGGDHGKAPSHQSFTHAQNLPRENVSWYDAMAFCRWLSRRVGCEIRLPTEWEWQWAAQGSDGRAYPWGNNFDQSRCNTGKSNLKQTTPVCGYPDGASSYGVLDMSGNVWEWCLNEYQTPKNTNTVSNIDRAVRGGSWNLDFSFARATFRNIRSPHNRCIDIGFRVACGSYPKPPKQLLGGVRFPI